MKTMIKSIKNVSSEGVVLTLTQKAALNGGLSTDQWFVSWDKIGRSLFKEQYTDAVSVSELKVDRGEIEIQTQEQSK